MDGYNLIDVDKTEASIVRRRLHQWSRADEEVIKPLVLAIQEQQCLPNFPIVAPRWETNVYPLYYWVRDKVGRKKVYEHVFTSLPQPQEELRVHVRAIVNSEIDILVEDADYFLFVEAKIPIDGQTIKFQMIRGVHQLVRQYVQGRILEKCIRKPFALVTIGANSGETIRIDLNPTEQELLRLVGEEKESREIIDLPWSLLMPPKAYGD
jgi:hypothetical protein